MASRITALSEEQDQLQPQHMGAGLGRSNDTAGDMLVKPIHAAWQADDRVASSISIYMSGAFNKVVPVRHLHNPSKRYISHQLVQFISSFLSDIQLVYVFLASFLLPFCLSKVFP